MPARSRFSHRHLLALATFLVPLAILAVLGWSELRRTGADAQAALEREGRQFLSSARHAIEQHLDRWLARALEQSTLHLAALGPVRTTLRLAEDPELAAVRGIVLLDANANVREPLLPLDSIRLPLASDPQRGPDNVIASLKAADHLLSHLRVGEARELLRPLVERLAKASAPGEDNRRAVLLACEAQARLKLASAEHFLDDVEAARAQYAQALRIARELDYPHRSWTFEFGLVAELGLAELSAPADRLALLREIAENRRDYADDAQLSAVAHRLAASFHADDQDRHEVNQLLQQEECRASIRMFAAAYEVAIKPFVGRRTRRSTTDTGESPLDDPDEIERLVSTPSGAEPTLVCIRPATAAERSRFVGCSRVALQCDLRALLDAIWQRFQSPDGTFVLAVNDPDDTVLVPPPAAPPGDFLVRVESTNDLTLRAYPADPARLTAEAEAAANKRTLLVLALFVTALGGALWSWRSVSRETELAALKIDLVSRVSHELKTPLALVRMYGETLSLGRARDPAQAAEFGAIIAREAERLTALIQRILDFSRQQAGTLSYAPAPIDLGELLRSVVGAYAPHLEARGALVVDTLPHGIRVDCDPNACESAIVNLLENAAKYGVEGEAEHEIELVLERQGPRAVIEVRDRGRGIPPSERDRVFEGFYRASNAGEVRGAGLGLSLVRHFARAHGGEIQALPRDGGGTVMRLVLPLAGAADGTAAPLPSASLPKAGPPVPTAP